jgi:hypothetical protein
VTRRPNTSWAAALAAGLLLTLAGCGGSGSAAATKTQDVEHLGETLQTLVGQVHDMGIVEWRGQLLTKNPDKNGKLLLDLNGRFSPSTGYTEVSMNSTIDGTAQQVDYLVVNDRTYFNSEAWGPRPDLAAHARSRAEARGRRRRRGSRLEARARGSPTRPLPQPPLGVL